MTCQCRPDHRIGSIIYCRDHRALMPSGARKRLQRLYHQSRSHQQSQEWESYRLLANELAATLYAKLPAPELKGVLVALNGSAATVAHSTNT